MKAPRQCRRAIVLIGAAVGASTRQIVAMTLAEIDLVDDKEGKPVGIQSRIGRRPIAAFGNSDGDLQMLQWTTAGPGARFALFVHDDDEAREFGYDRDATSRGSVSAGTKRSPGNGPSSECGTTSVMLRDVQHRRRGRIRASCQCGPVAQLGARMNGIHEVTGSIPVWSITLNPQQLS
jgi:hypothetical protein